MHHEVWILDVYRRPGRILVFFAEALIMQKLMTDDGLFNIFLGEFDVVQGQGLCGPE